MTLRPALAAPWSSTIAQGKGSLFLIDAYHRCLVSHAEVNRLTCQGVDNFDDGAGSLEKIHLSWVGASYLEDADAQGIAPTQWRFLYITPRQEDLDQVVKASLGEVKGRMLSWPESALWGTGLAARTGPALCLPIGKATT